VKVRVSVHDRGRNGCHNQRSLEKDHRRGKAMQHLQGTQRRRRYRIGAAAYLYAALKGPDAFRARIAREVPMYKEIIDQAGLQIQ
jgi:hypothetical protein